MVCLKLTVCFFIVVLFTVQVFGASVFVKRSPNGDGDTTNSTEQTEKKDPCIGKTPCGWAVYTRGTRVIDYFMQNRCACPEDKKCLRDDDDISITAYVYRCKEDSQKS